MLKFCEVSRPFVDGEREAEDLQQGHDAADSVKRGLYARLPCEHLQCVVVQ